MKTKTNHGFWRRLVELGNKDHSAEVLATHDRNEINQTNSQDRSVCRQLLLIIQNSTRVPLGQGRNELDSLQHRTSAQGNILCVAHRENVKIGLLTDGD